MLEWKEADSVEEAQSLSGVLFPDLSGNPVIRSMELAACFYMSGLLELRYEDNSDNSLIIRKTGRRTPKLSGDYSSYPCSYDLPCKGVILHCRGTEEHVSCCEFDPFGGSVSIQMNPGMIGQGLAKPDLLDLAGAFILQ